MKDKNSVALNIGLIAFAVVMLFPFILMLSTSLKTMPELQEPGINFLPKAWEFKNYALAMQKGNWPLYIRNSLFVTVVTTLVSLVFNSMAGFAFARIRFPGRNLLFFGILLGIMIPPQVVMVPLFIIMKNFPLAGGNNWLGQGGFGLVNTYSGLILPFVSGSFGVFLCRQFFLAFPRSMDEAAKLDGCNYWQTFRHIYLPLSKPILATLGSLKATSTWNDYVWPLVITNSDRLRTVQLGLTIFRSETVVEWHLLMAATAITVIPLIVLFIAAQKYFTQGFITSGVKG